MSSIGNIRSLNVLSIDLVSHFDLHGRGRSFAYASSDQGSDLRVVSRTSCGRPIKLSMIDRISLDVSLARKIELKRRQMYPTKVRTSFGLLAALESEVDTCVKTALIAAIFLFRRCSDSALRRRRCMSSFARSASALAMATARAVFTFISSEALWKRIRLSFSIAATASAACGS